MLARLALRLATVQALRGRTLAGASVRDSELSPIDEVGAAEAAPVVVVYTDDGNFSAAGRDLFACQGDGRVEFGYQQLVIEIALTKRMKFRAEDGLEVEDVLPPALDPALAFALDLIERQIYCALMDTAPGAVWAEMWRRLAIDVGDRVSQLGNAKHEGLRVAGRQIRLSVRLPRDPAPGAAAGPLWTDFMALVAATPDLAPLVPALTAALAGTPVTDWRQTARTYGLTGGEARAMLIAPPPPAETTAPDFDDPTGAPAVPVPPTYTPTLVDGDLP